jgi:hypothetical protein
MRTRFDRHLLRRANLSPYPSEVLVLLPRLLRDIPTHMLNVHRNVIYSPTLDIESFRLLIMIKPLNSGPIRKLISLYFSECHHFGTS